MSRAREAAIYEIRVQGALGEAFLGGFPQLSGQALDGITVLSGRLSDQSALYGVLTQIESLGLVLLAVRRVD